MKIGVLGGQLNTWQERALEQIQDENELFWLRCSDPPRSRSLGHALYYALNLIAIRNRMTRRSPNAHIQFIETHDFEVAQEDAWSRLPPETLAWARKKKLDVIIRFGLGLLHVPPEIPVISYHHGDPRKYRGRPAGFYEHLNGERHIGQIIQILGSRLDGGEVLAFGESAVAPYSYRQTLITAYSLSPHLLRSALRSLQSGERLAIQPSGRNYRLPSNLIVARMIVSLAKNFIKHLAYGAFIEKMWRVSTAKGCPLELSNENWVTPPIRAPYIFYADGFFHDGDIVVEAMNGRNGKGELMTLSHGQTIKGFGGHVSYPCSFEGHIIPETVNWAPVSAYRIADGEAKKVAELDIEDPMILDPTLLRHKGIVYLFGNRVQDGPSVLSLWVADNLFARFVRHPLSPIRTSIRGSRMAGAISGNIRFGQDLQRAYGDGVIAFQIKDLSPTNYREVLEKEISFREVRGPHTINSHGDIVLFDWYSERFSLLAGVRRVLHKI